MIPFFKYQGTGNDFVMIDNRKKKHLTRKDTNIIKQLCDRKFGIGADGLILLENHTDYDFEMIYFNADGNESTMCGNGGRCIVAFAKQLGIIKDQTKFIAIDGEHEASINDNNWVSLKMINVENIEHGNDYFVLNTGSPHYVQFVDKVENIDVFKAGQTIRYNDRFREEGINVNFVEKLSDNKIKVVTYERGVEDETLSCGTGVTASSIAYQILSGNDKGEVKIATKGGNLAVKLTLTNHGAKEIWLSGSATNVFEGKIGL